MTSTDPYERRFSPPARPSITNVGSVKIPGGDEGVSISSLAGPSLRGTQNEVQSIFCDASRSIGRITVISEDAEQVAYWPAGSFGWQTLFLKDTLRFRAICPRSVTVNFKVASSLIPPYVTDGGRIHPLIMSQSRYEFVLAASSPVILFPTSAAGIESSRSAHMIKNSAATKMYLLMDDNGIVGPLKQSYSLCPGELMIFELPYTDEIRAVWDAGFTPGEGAHTTRFYREL